MAHVSTRYQYDMLHGLDSAELSQALVHAKFRLEMMLSEESTEAQLLAHVGFLGLWRFIAESRSFRPEDRFVAACKVIGKEPSFCNDRSRLPKQSGCYCVMDQKNILYVGESTNIKLRVANRFLSATNYGFFLCEITEAKEYELDLICCLRPVDNHPVAVPDDSYYC